MTTTPSIEQIMQALCSTDLAMNKHAEQLLIDRYNDDIAARLILLLASKDPSIRNNAALVIRRACDNRAIDALFTAIFKEENLNQNGTLVYTLESLDCSKHLSLVFNILFYQGFEAKLSAHRILSQQEFEFTKQELSDILARWEDIKIHNEKCPDYNGSKEMIQNSIDGFAGYLEW